MCPVHMHIDSSNAFRERIAGEMVALVDDQARLALIEHSSGERCTERPSTDDQVVKSTVRIHRKRLFAAKVASILNRNALEGGDV